MLRDPLNSFDRIFRALIFSIRFLLSFEYSYSAAGSIRNTSVTLSSRMRNLKSCAYRYDATFIILNS